MTTRRGFLREMGLASACAALGAALQACEDEEVLDDWSSKWPVTFDTDEAPFDQLVEEGSVVALDEEVALINIGGGEIIAISRHCSFLWVDQATEPLTWRWDGEARTLTCSGHQCRFDEHGASLSGRAPLTRYALTHDVVSGRGVVWGARGG